MFSTSEHALKTKARTAFEAAFGAPAEAVAFAPGRVNLLGEHTDYNGGFVLPMPLGLGVAVALDRGGEPGTVRLSSDQFAESELRRIDEAAKGVWSDYILGSLKAVASPQIARAGLRVLVAGNLPVGAGLSSSAAVEVCTLRAVGDLFASAADPVAIAKTARAVENAFVGMPCGIMDQFAVSVGRPGTALFLDTRKLEHRPAPLPEGHSFVVIHSGVSHKLTDDGYATRVAECNAAARALGVAVLSDLGEADLARVAALPDPLDRRARHIVTENQRVLDGSRALDAGDAEGFGRLMTASHVSQRDDYDVSVPEVDALVDAALRFGAEGARLTGGGFGGSVVALARADRVGDFCDRITGEHERAHILAVC
jgi:galactokinase